MTQFDRRVFLASGAIASVAAMMWAMPAPAEPAPGSRVTPEMFGARGDGATNDTAAFQALGEWLSRNGGTAVFRSVVYIVGRNLPQRSAETEAHSYTFLPVHLLHINGARRPVRLEGNGATVRAASGLRYGTFAADGTPTRNTLPFYGKEIAAGYHAMIEIEDCRAEVTVDGFDLDGRMERARIGGPWGDAGYQLPGSGIIARNNRARWRVSNVRSFHHPLDGIIVDDGDQSIGSGTERCDFYENGRQGMSLVGGQGLAFSDTRFRRTRRGTAVRSPPGAGLDIEGEGKEVRNVAFERCEFSDNEGGGMVAAEGRARGVRFADCLFIGTTFWSAWPNKPGFRFDGCTFVGAVVNVFGSDDPAEATRFRRCRFTDDPSLSPTGLVFGRTGGGKPIVDLSDNRNVVFEDCRFDVSGEARLPWSTQAVFYRDCSFRQASPKVAFTRGTFSGRTVINGPVTITDSRITGTFIRNGETIAPGSY